MSGPILHPEYIVTVSELTYTFPSVLEQTTEMQTGSNNATQRAVCADNSPTYLPSWPILARCFDYWERELIPYSTDARVCCTRHRIQLKLLSLSPFLRKGMMFAAYYEPPYGPVLLSLTQQILFWYT